MYPYCPYMRTGFTKTKTSAVIDNFLQILAIRVLLLLFLSLVVGVAQLGQNKYFKKVAFNYFICAGFFFKSLPMKRINVEYIFENLVMNKQKRYICDFASILT